MGGREQRLSSAVDQSCSRSPTPRWDPWLHGVGFGIAFLLISYAHVVFRGGSAQNLAIERPTGWPFWWRRLVIFDRVSSRLCFLQSDGGGDLRGPSACEAVIAARPLGRGNKVHVSSSRARHLHRFEEDAFRHSSKCKTTTCAKSWCSQRHCLGAVDASLDEVLRRMRENQYSRLPVYEGDPERIIGYVHLQGHDAHVGGTPCGPREKNVCYGRSSFRV